MSNDRNKTPKNTIPAVSGSDGQQNFWPSEGAQQAGTIKDGDETTTIPVVDSVQEKTKNQTEK